MSSLSITVTYSAGSVVINGPGTPQVIQLGTLSAAVNQQITQAISASAASAAAAAESAASIAQLYLGVFTTNARPTPIQTGQFGIDTTNGFVVVTQLSPVVWTNSAGLPV